MEEEVAVGWTVEVGCGGGVETGTSPFADSTSLGSSADMLQELCNEHTR